MKGRRNGRPCTQGPSGRAERRLTRVGLPLFALLACAGGFAPPNVLAAIGGRFGLEVDGLGEEYESYGLFDERLRQSGSTDLDIDLDQAPVRSRDVAALGLLEMRWDVGRRSSSWLQLSESARWGAERSRSSLLAELELRGDRDRLRIENQWDLQRGDEEPAAGSQDALQLTWDRDSLPGGVSSQIRLGADWSEAARDSLAALLDTRAFRARAQVKRALTRAFELRGAIGLRSREALRSESGSYDAWTAEAEAEGSLGARDQIELTARYEDRAYEADSGGIPSSRLAHFTGRYEIRANRTLRPYLDLGFESQDYEAPTSIFQDHDLLTAEVGTDVSVNALRGRDTSEDPLAADWRLRGGAQAERLRSRIPSSDTLATSSSYDSYGALLGIAREGAEEVWFDLALEAGRRDYRRGGARTNLIFEGLNFSLSTSDYTYLRATLLGEWTPVRWLRAEAFFQWDEEIHAKRSDDFRLWIMTFSLTHPF